jgi:predicted regulator of Ras-like GTPase activity (Roadblock/LC7/MglB family)
VPFSEVLTRIADRVPETRVLMIIGTDGIPIERLIREHDPNLESIAAEYTTLLRSSLAAVSDTGLGDLHELSIITERTATLMVGITRDYFLFALLAPGAIIGRARFMLRLEGAGLEREFL